MNEKMILKDEYNNIEYIFTIIKEGTYLHFIVTENDEKCPFIYENTFDLEDFIQHHKAFKSCDDISQIEQHFYNLYQIKKLSIYEIGSNNEKQIEATIYFLSEETKTKEFNLYRKFKYNDNDVLEFYNKYKKDKQFKEKIKNKIEKNLKIDNPLRKDIFELIEESNK